MVLNNTNKNNFLILEVLASVFTVSSNFPDNPRISLSKYLVLILKFYTVPVRLHDVTNFLNHETLQSKHVTKFFTAKIWRHFSITSQLR